MYGFFQKIVQPLIKLFDQLDLFDLVPHPLKRYSRRVLCAGTWLAALIHFSIIGGYIVFRMIAGGDEVRMTLRPYPKAIDLIDISELITSEQSGGGGGAQKTGGEPPPFPGEEILSKGTPVPVKIGIPVPVDDNLIEEEMTIANQQEMEKDIALAEDTEADSLDQPGLADAGGGAQGDGGIGGDVGAGGGGGGDGLPGAWRYDTPPSFRRIRMPNKPKKYKKVESDWVRFRVLINEFGEVVDANITESTGYTELDAIALKALYDSSFNPATFQGRTVKAWKTVGIRFSSKN